MSITENFKIPCTFITNLIEINDEFQKFHISATLDKSGLSSINYYRKIYNRELISAINHEICNLCNNLSSIDEWKFLEIIENNDRIFSTKYEIVFKLNHETFRKYTIKKSIGNHILDSWKYA